MGSCVTESQAKKENVVGLYEKEEEAPTYGMAPYGAGTNGKLVSWVPGLYCLAMHVIRKTEGKSGEEFT
jgi:hypothetical protein